ncbi:MAG: alkaline phosphatase family protein [Bacteroidota bacterium]
MKSSLLFNSAILGLSIVIGSPHYSVFAQESTPPKLVLQITVDQLRGDLPFRYQRNFTDGGFKLLMNSGVWYTEAHHPHYVTETVVGHATLATGTYPSEHGMVGNNWYDAGEEKFVYSVRDERYPLLTSEGREPQGGAGSSPNTLLAPTLADRIYEASGGVAKVFSVSLKDRAAVAMGGKQGKAFWYSTANGNFVSSAYYYEEYPQWVNDFNEQKLANRYHQQSWKLLLPRRSYVNKKRKPKEDAQIQEIEEFNQKFPHNFADSSSTYFYQVLRLSPAGDSLTARFAKELIVKETLGKDDVTDYLSISFSATDNIGHMFGPNSLESEDQIIRLDGILADLFNFVDEQVGLDQTLVVLSADHGITDCIYKQLRDNQEAIEFYFDRLIPTADSEMMLMEKFGAGTGQLVRIYYYPFIYLNHDFIEERGLSLAEVTKVVASAITTVPGVRKAIPVEQIFAGNAEGIDDFERIQRSVHPARAGDIFIDVNDNAVLRNFRGAECANHSTPDENNTHVPVAFLVNGRRSSVDRRISIVDVVPTICEIVGIDAPGKASGAVLNEVVE